MEVPDESDLQGDNFRVTHESIYLFWDDVGRFKLTKGKEVVIDPHPEVDEYLLSMFLTGSVLALTLNQRGYHLIHASCVKVDGYAVAFLGGSGYGKSTLANYFYKNGYPVVADDYVALTLKGDVAVVTPGFPTLKLSPQYIDIMKIDPDDVLRTEHDLKSNYVHAGNGFSGEELILKGLYIIDPGEPLSLRKLDKQEAMENLLRYSYAIKVLTNPQKVENLKNNALLIKNTNLNLLTVPRDLEVLEQVYQMVLEDLRK